MRGFLAAAALAALALALTGCGQNEPEAPLRPAIESATQVDDQDFPAAEGRTLQEIADTLRPGPDVGLATSVFTPGDNRLAFGLIDQENAFVYGKTALYVARSPDEKAEGPFPAPADSLAVESPFRSAGGPDEDIAAIYSAEVPLERPGRYAILAMTQLPQGAFGGAATVEVARDSKIPDSGERAPRASTDTLAAAGGDVAQIDTRVPPDDMHDVDFADVVGKRPVAVLFATPQLCQTRVCGPVTDLLAQLKTSYGDRMEFIHQEVYVDNQVERGLRPPLEAFGLETEPWLFTVDRDGRVAARLEGSFGLEESREAIEAAL